MAKKDLWNTLPPADDKQFAQYVAHPELAALLPVLYPGVFPNLDALNKSGKARADLLAVLLRAVAGVTYALVDKAFTPDAAAGLVTDGLTPASLDVPYLDTFPYLGVPHSGFTTPAS